MKCKHDEAPRSFCWLGWHQWTSWEQYERQVLWSPGRIAPKVLHGQWYEDAEEQQRRVCRHCGKKQDEQVRQSGW